jgi:hypothetical protein
MPRRVLVLALLAFAAAPHAAAAATITTDRACYRPGATATATFSGFTAGPDPFDLRVNDDVAAEVRIDGAGAGSATFRVPRGAPPQPVTVRLQDSLAILAETTVRVSVPVVEMSPTRAKPTTRVAYLATGFDTGGPVYLHVVRGRRALRTLRLGTADRPCGEVLARIAQIPLRGPVAKGTYRLQFDASRSYRAGRPGAVVRTRVVR